MMSAMLVQVPLAWLPGDAEEVASGVGVVPGADGGGVVWVHGLATFAWDGGDEAARRLAAVQLVRLRAAAQRQGAAAFGTGPVTVWRGGHPPGGDRGGGAGAARQGGERPPGLNPARARRGPARGGRG